MKKQDQLQESSLNQAERLSANCKGTRAEDRFNFFAYCLQFYRSVSRDRKINPPMDNVNKRNLRTEMTEPFKNWADVYFDITEGNCNKLVERDIAMRDFESKSGQHKWTTNKFTKAIKAWCKYTDYVEILNPSSLENSAGRITRQGTGGVSEMIYIQTRGERLNLYPTNLPIDDKNTQYLFFSNRTWKVTAEGILELKPTEVERRREEEVITHKVCRKDPPFRITFNKERNEFDIEVLNQESLFFRFLTNASRIHWRAERLRANCKGPRAEDRWNIASTLLENEEAREQKHHLINKIFSIGYLLHRYKDPARPWCVIAMDNISEPGEESHGRSGKSLCYRTIRYFMKSVTLNGRNPKLTENQYVYDLVTEHTDTDYILVDDADQYLNYGFFFKSLQGDHVPKLCITSNFSLNKRAIDRRTEDRILCTAFSDFYHVKSEGKDYEEDFTIRDDFGKNLFLDYTEDDWNNDFNFFAACLQFYLSVPRDIKINPPAMSVR